MRVTLQTVFFALTAFAFLAFDSDSSAQDKKKKVANTVTGKVQEVDAEKGLIRLIVVTANKKDKAQSNPQYKVDDDTEITLDNGKAVMGKDGLKDIKEGAMVSVMLDKDFKTVSIKVGAAAKK